MTTQKQIEANRRNALKSTGPRTARGRARASQNARTHGLTASPDWGEIVSWYRLILGDPGAVPDALNPDPRRSAAFQLARCEAQRAAAMRKESEGFAKITDAALQYRDESIFETRARRRSRLRSAKLLSTYHWEPAKRAWAFKLWLYLGSLPAGATQNLSSVTRYRREAEAQRRRALAHWIATEASGADPSKSRNEANYP